MAKKLNRRVRGIRTSIPAGYIVGRPTGAGTGDAQLIPLNQIVQNLAAAGGLPANPGHGITELTGDVTAGPGSGSQVATLAASGVTAGSYTNADITVDAKGRVTAASNGSTGSAPNGMLPLVTGETPGPIPIADGNGQFIGVAL